MIVHWPLSALHHIKCLSQQGCFKDEVRFFFKKKRKVLMFGSWDSSLLPLGTSFNKLGKLQQVPL